MAKNIKPFSKIENLEELKTELAKFLKKVKNDNVEENSSDEIETDNPTYWYNVGQIDLANSILAQIGKL